MASKLRNSIILGAKLMKSRNMSIYSHIKLAPPDKILGILLQIICFSRFYKDLIQ